MPLVVADLDSLHAALARVGDRSPSIVADHGEACCITARAWLGAVDRSWAPPTRVSGLAWIRKLYRWGPSPWPLHWCTLVDRLTLDSAALASMAHEVLRLRGALPLRVQLLRRASVDELHHWRTIWEQARCPTGWIFEKFAYQEAVAVVADGRLLVFDPAQARELPTDPVGGPGSVSAIKVSGLPQGQPLAQETLSWGLQALRPEAWQVLGLQEARLVNEGLEEDHLR